MLLVGDSRLVGIDGELDEGKILARERSYDHEWLTSK